MSRKNLMAGKCDNAFAGPFFFSRHGCYKNLGPKIRSSFIQTSPFSTTASSVLACGSWFWITCWLAVGGALPSWILMRIGRGGGQVARRHCSTSKGSTVEEKAPTVVSPCPSNLATSSLPHDVMIYHHFPKYIIHMDIRWCCWWRFFLPSTPSISRDSGFWDAPVLDQYLTSLNWSFAMLGATAFSSTDGWFGDRKRNSWRSSPIFQ